MKVKSALFKCPVCKKVVEYFDKLKQKTRVSICEKSGCIKVNMRRVSNG